MPLQVTDKFINMVRYRGEDAKNLSGHGLTTLAEGLSLILLNPATTSPDSVVSQSLSLLFLSQRGCEHSSDFHYDICVTHPASHPVAPAVQCTFLLKRSV